MPHPFFDSVTYPWHREDARNLHQVLWKGSPQVPRIDKLYKASVSNPLPLNMADAPDIVWKAALEALATASGLRKLCTLLHDEPGLEATLDAVRAVEAAEDPIEKKILTDDRVFIDRQPMRDKLQRVALSPTVRVLLVRGGASSGKSWTQYMVAELARTMGEPCIYLFEGQVSTVDDVVDQLFTNLGDPGAVPPRMETEDAWFKKVCLRLQVVGKNSGKASWIVVDDLGEGEQARLDPQIRQFFDQFALSMANPEFAKWFRLVLIDYPHVKAQATARGVPTRWKDFWDEDRPDAASVEAGDIATFLLSWAGLKQKNLAQADADKFALDIISAASSPEPGALQPTARLRRIHDEIVAALPKL